MVQKIFRVIEPEVSAATGSVRVSLVGRHEIYYSDGSRIVVFEREPLFDGDVTIAYEICPPSEWNWEPPHEAEAIPEGHRASIVADVRAAMAALGTRAVFPGELL